MAAGVICNARGEILVARRFEHAHQGGRWEFPGGKLEPGEDVRAGLARELDEELGISLDSARPLIRVRHDYPDRAVLLDVWRVTGWQGRVHSREGQALRWLGADAFTGLLMPAADVPVVKALRLPDCYLVTPSPGSDRGVFLAALSASIDAGVELVSLRAKELPAASLVSLCRQAAGICRARGARLLINADPELLAASGADGIHLDSARLMATTSRPVPAGVSVARMKNPARSNLQARHTSRGRTVLPPANARGRQRPGNPQLTRTDAVR